MTDSITLSLSKPLKHGNTTAKITSYPYEGEVVLIDPSVLHIILDHHTRRNDDQVSGIGALIGTRKNSRRKIKSTTIRSAFPVPHQFKDNQEVFVDIEFQDHMFELLQNSVKFPKAEIIGWYSTIGDSVTINSDILALHNFYSETLDIPFPLFLSVDINFSEGLKTNLWTNIVEIPNSEENEEEEEEEEVEMFPFSETFSTVPFRYSSFSEADRIVLDTLIATTQPNRENGITEGYTPLLSGKDLLINEMIELRDSLRDAKSYVKSVLGEEFAGSRFVGRELNECITRIPSVNSGVVDSSLVDEAINDTLMVSHLALMIREQLAMTEKLGSVPITRRVHHSRDK